MIDRQTSLKECFRCSRLAVPGRMSCEEHLAIARRATKKYLKTEKGRANRTKINGRYSIQQREYRRGKGHFEYVKQYAIRKGKGWTLTRAQYDDIISMPCNYCGLAHDVGAGSGLDRLNNAKGYHPGNVVSCCSDCNYARRHIFTPEEMKIIDTAIRQVKLARLEASNAG